MLNFIQNIMSFSFVRIILDDTEIEIYQRGLAYFNRNAVDGNVIGTATYRAKVKGTKQYDVDLGFKRTGNPRYSCSCPYFAQNKFVCKHIIAAALAWDTSRKVPLPTSGEIESLCIPPPDVTYADIDKAYADPLHADLNILRLTADNVGSWSRPHVRLPDKPRPCEKPLQNIKELIQARYRILEWSNRRGFDMYFCAGEMEAGFCEILRWLAKTFLDLSLINKLESLRIVVKLHHEILECIDDSDGLHIFGETHLFNLCNVAENDKNISLQKQETLKKIRIQIQEY